MFQIGNKEKWDEDIWLSEIDEEETSTYRTILSLHWNENMLKIKVYGYWRRNEGKGCNKPTSPAGHVLIDRSEAKSFNYLFKEDNDQYFFL